MSMKRALSLTMACLLAFAVTGCSKEEIDQSVSETTDKMQKAADTRESDNFRAG